MEKPTGFLQFCRGHHGWSVLRWHYRLGRVFALHHLGFAGLGVLTHEHQHISFISAPLVALADGAVGIADCSRIVDDRGVSEDQKQQGK